MIEPILATRDPNLMLTNPMVIVIDALDECNDKDLMVQFLEIITEAG
jgi:hypothetical protein